VTPFTNTHLSYSRLSRFEQCPRSFKFQYIDRLPSEPGMPLRFGKVVHAALERLLREVIEQERTGPLDEKRAVTLFAEAWRAEGLAGLQEFAAGVQMIRAHVRAEGVVDHRDVLAVEREFRLKVGPYEVLGFIDRVNRIDDETIEVVDYKTNRQLFTRDELDGSLQMSLYEIAVRQLWPWAKKVRLAFVMLRHGLRQTTSRTPEELDAALAYVESLGRMTEEAREYPARVGGLCVYCDHRAHCDAYAQALAGGRLGLAADPADLEAVAREREEVASLAKIMYARKSELEGVLKEQLRERDELLIGRMRYSLATTSSQSYPLEPTLKVLAERTGKSRDELLRRIAIVDKDALDAIVKETTKKLDKSGGHLFRAELEAVAERHVTPRFTAKEVRA
jgi:RecB family exonuclease